MHLHEGQNTRRERWSLTLRFPFLSAIGSQLVVFNPMGILITYPQADLALVTEQPLRRSLDDPPSSSPTRFGCGRFGPGSWSISPSAP